MRILITGAGGFLGSAACHAFASTGWEVYALVRRQPEEPLSGVRYVVYDLTDPAEQPASALLARLRPGVVLHAAARVSSGPTDWEAAWETNVEATARLLHAAREAGVERWIQVSSMSAHAGNRSAYGGTKFAADAVVRSGGIPWVIVRPSLIYGPGPRGVFQKLARLVDRLPVVPFPAGDALFAPVHVDDLCHALTEAASRPHAAGRSYQVGGEEVTLCQLLKALARRRGPRRVALVGVPQPLCRLAALAGDLLLENPPLTLDNLEGLTAVERTDSTDAVQELDFRARPLAQGLAELDF